jgi:hypothetical protein
VQPVFVLHGVANRDKKGFEKEVRDLQQAAGAGWELHAVFWGQLGADDDFVRLTIPSLDPTDLRDEDSARTDDAQQLAESLMLAEGFAAQGASDLRDGDPQALKSAQLAAVGTGVRRAAGEGDGSGDGRGEVRDDPFTAEVLAEIEQEWESTRWLRLVTDADMLERTGAAVAAAARDHEAGAGGAEQAELRGIDVGAFVRRRLHELDELVGATVGATAGRVNTWARSGVAPGVARFFGDVLVYQRHRSDIQKAVLEQIHAVDAELGSQDGPVQVLAHSLGGVIALDMATGENPLWISRLVTFGSQFSLFHAIDPRAGLLAPLTEHNPATLPPSVGAWTNLWEPMDLLAFLAGSVFRLQDGSAPADLPVPHLASSGLWTHSAYWHLAALTATMRRVFR